MRAHNPPSRDRIDWVDIAKGFCIVMVVMMHSTLGVEAAAGREGFMHAFVAFAKPFRMPDFFLISGLFLSRVLDLNWRSYLDRKLAHFAYFYVLWVTIQFAFKAPAFAVDHGWLGVIGLYLEAFIEPFGTLWFIYLLPIFFIVTKATRALPPALIWGFAAALEILPVETGWTVIDEFAGRFVYFYTGYLAARHIFAFADAVQADPHLALMGLAGWALVNGALVALGWADWPLVSLALGLVGAGAVVSASALLARTDWVAWLRYCGEHSIVIYLAFFLPMSVTRTVLLKTGLIADVGLIALIVTVVGVAGALAIWWGSRAARLHFLFERPLRFRIPPRRIAVQAAQ